MKKVKLIMLIVILMLFSTKVYAKDADANITASSTTVTLGSDVEIRVSTYKLWGTYSISTSNTNILGGGCQDSIGDDIATVKCTFSTKNTGTAVVTFGPNGKNNLANPDNGQLFNETRSITINVVKKYVPPAIDVNPTYNKNNYLKSLSIEGYELDKSFDKDTLEYNVTLNPGTDKINVSAEVEDSTAKTKGTGEISVSEGINTIEIVVTAENGNERTYKILASVEEKDPIEVEINNEKYRVVKNKDLIGTKDGYNETTVKIKDFDIPALYNEVTKVTLIGLKDKEGNIKLYSYDSSNGEYSEYKEFKFDLMQLYIHENKKSKYNKVNIKINDVDVLAYELEGIKDYYLLYATNTSTGYTGYYMYDVKENSVQRYNTFMLDKLTKEKDKYLSIILVLSSVCFLTMLFLLIEVNRDSKRDEG